MAHSSASIRQQLGRTGGRAAAGGLALALLMLPAAAEADRTVYVTGVDDNAVAALDVGASGGLTVLGGSPTAAGTASMAVTSTPDGRSLYVSNSGSNDVSAYTVSADGSLSPVVGSPFFSGAFPWGIAAAPDGEHLFVANSGAYTVAVFDIAANGALSPVVGSPFATGVDPRSLVVDPDGQHLYVTNTGSNTISVYAIAGDGSLTPLGPAPGTGGPGGVAITPDGDHLYVANVIAGSLSGYAVAADGTLSELSGSPYLSGGDIPLDLAISPNGASLYVTHRDSDTVGAFEVGAAGDLTPVVGSPYATGDAPSAVVASPDGGYLYVSHYASGSIAAYSVGAGGALADLAGSPYTAGVPASDAFGMVVSPNQGPAASFTAAGARAGSPSAFNGSASADSDGTVARYDWDFGDGATLSSSDPAVAHTYASAGTYAVSLTVTDDEGCSTRLVYTGRTASCNGAGVAAATRSVTVPGVAGGASAADPAPVITNLRVSPRRFTASSSSTPVALRRGAKIGLTLSEAASVRLRIRARGHGLPPDHLRALVRSLEAGASTVGFTGKIGRRTLLPGRYVVVAQATDSSGQLSTRVVARFRVTAG